MKRKAYFKLVIWSTSWLVNLKFCPKFSTQ